MTLDPCWPDVEKVPEIGDSCELMRAEMEELKASILQEEDVFPEIYFNILSEYISVIRSPKLIVSHSWWRDLRPPRDLRPFNILFRELDSSPEEPLLVGGRRVVDAIVVSAVNLLSLVYLYLVGYIDKGGSKAEVAYRIAAFYCNKPRHRLGRLDLGGGASLPIPALSVDLNLPYEEKVNQVGDQVLRVYAEFEELRKASRSLPPTSPTQQLRQQPLNSRMDLAMQDQGFQSASDIHNEVDFNNPSSAVLAKTQHELLEALKQIECLKARVSELEVENMGWEIKCSELERSRFSELERGNGLLNHHVIMQSQPPLVDPELDFDPDMLLNMGHEESLAR